MAPEPLGGQAAIFAFLRDSATHGSRLPVEQIDTHGAAVFLVGSEAYKVKRAVRFPYMDFSTLEKRRAACVAEIAVNHANAPMIYLGAIPITRDRSGFHLDGPGEVVEWAVHMRRFDETATFDRLADHGPLGDGLIRRLAHRVATAHGRASRCDGDAATDALRSVLIGTLGELEAMPEIFPPADTARLRLLSVGAFASAEAVLRRRGAAGKVRRCHGDLHLGNVALVEGEPVLFDAIEFDEAIASIDLLYDLAFLLMDLCRRGLVADANRLLNRYLWSCEDIAGEIAGLALLPLFLSLRAAIRAKVAASRFELAHAPETRREATAYLTAALGSLDHRPARLVAIGGLSGTGKSTLAAALAPTLGMAPGAVHLRSDIERKRMFGAAETQRLPAEGYTRAVSAHLFAQLEALAAIGLAAGRAVVLDAAYLDPNERAGVEALARRAGVAFTGIWLDVPMAVRLERVAARMDDASDATVAIASGQKAAGSIGWHRLDAGTEPEALLAAAVTTIKG